MRNFHYIILVFCAFFIAYSFKFKKEEVKFDTAILEVTGAKSNLFKLKIAKSEAQLEHGLMFVKEMPEDEAMIFYLPDEKINYMWMKNTYIPLDMAFVGSDMQIKHIHKMAAPLSEYLISSVRPVKYVIEFNGGIADKLGIEVGDKITVVEAKN
jgi:uncharacterized membrane protein (UPF0127 family)